MTGTRNARRARPVGGRVTRWYQRVLPVTALALALVAVAALASPGFRHQVALSASHRAEPYVELAFARPDAGPPMVCGSSGGSARVDFEITSHLADTERLDYDLVVDGVRHDGSVSVEPGRTTRVTRLVGSAAKPYEVSVLLPSAGERLHARCPGSGR